MSPFFRSLSIVPPNGADRIEAESDFEADSVRYPARIEAESDFEADSVRYPARIEAESDFEADSVRRPSCPTYSMRSKHWNCPAHHHQTCSRQQHELITPDA
jgi:hypothetical protein